MGLVRILLRERFLRPFPRRANVRRKLLQTHSVHAACRAVVRRMTIRQGALLHDMLAHISPRRVLVDVQHKISGHCSAVVQLRPSADLRVGGVSPVKMQRETKGAANAIQFQRPVDLLLRIAAPSLHARHARRCKAKLPTVDRRVVSTSTATLRRREDIPVMQRLTASAMPPCVAR